MSSFKQLDERIKQKKMRDLVALNMLGERRTIKKRADLHTFIMFIFSGVLMLISTLFNFTGTEKDTIQIVLGIVTSVSMIIAYFRSTKTSLLSIAGVLIAYGLYNLVILTIISDTFQITNILVGGFQILIALTYIQQAKHFDDLTSNIPDTVDDALYQDVFEALKTQQSNNSNMLIELKHTQQVITVWLRPSNIILLLHREQRLYFDMHHIFKLTASEKDMGSNMLRVDANIIDRSMKCTISRHAWLRYTQFIK